MTPYSSIDGSIRLYLNYGHYFNFFFLLLLQQSVPRLAAALADIAEACNKSEVRDALQYLRRQVMAIRVADVDLADAVTYHTAEAEVGRQLHSGELPQNLSAVHPAGNLPVADAGVTSMSGTDSELLIALAAADRAAAGYYTQLNYIYLALAEKEDELRSAEEALSSLRTQLQTDRYEAAVARKALEDQITLLSNQLTA